MVNSRKFKAAIVAAGKTQAELCSDIGMAPSTMIRKVKNGSFTVKEASAIIRVLGIERPDEIFFAADGT